MKPGTMLLLGALAAAAAHLVAAQSVSLTAPESVVAGSAFTIQTSGSGSGTLYVIGFGEALKRSVQLGAPADFSAGSLNNAGHYLVVLTGAGPAQTASFDVVPLKQPASISFLAKPTRLPVVVPNGITGAAYVFDSHDNLIVAPLPVSFELSPPAGAVQAHTVTTNNGSAWTTINSTGQVGIDKFVARAGNVSVARNIRQVSSDPCALSISAQPSGQRLQLQTAPVRDCSGNEVADGTIVTFTETYDGAQSTADVPVKHGIAKVEMPAYNGAMLSVASGVVLGNQIRWER